jgi:hypothetical protein
MSEDMNVILTTFGDTAFLKAKFFYAVNMVDFSS